MRNRLSCDRGRVFHPPPSPSKTSICLCIDRPRRQGLRRWGFITFQPDCTKPCPTRHLRCHPRIIRQRARTPGCSPAERRRFHHLGADLHHGHPCATGRARVPSSWSTLGGIAQATESIPSVRSSPFLRFGIRQAIVAQAAASVAAMMPGRVFLASVAEKI